ncbi:uncharacterized protein MONOS_13544 [Monocercomonoides exilis]|uniref:uncharacterized protein n=1 Tax=Monocercomonoides exilis TaxID=2049356 RepID=UPI00355A1DC5|nr:hypothetical protein MONOS_13544 [Monocercomonoides exilis]
MPPAAAVALISAPSPPINEALTPSLMTAAIAGSTFLLCHHRHANGESVLDLLGAVEVFGLPQLALMSPEKTLSSRSAAITTAEFESHLAGFPLEHTKSRSEADNTRFAYDTFYDSVIREQSVRLRDDDAVSDVLSYLSRLVFPTLFMPSYLTAGQLSDSTRLKSDFDGELPLFTSDTLSMPPDYQNNHSLGEPQLPHFLSFSPSLSPRKLIPDSSPTGSPSFSTSSTLLEALYPAATSVVASVSDQSFLS